jgi:hypothetical protein
MPRRSLTPAEISELNRQAFEEQPDYDNDPRFTLVNPVEAKELRELRRRYRQAAKDGTYDDQAARMADYFIEEAAIKAKYAQTGDTAVPPPDEAAVEPTTPSEAPSNPAGRIAI